MKTIIFGLLVSFNCFAGEFGVGGLVKGSKSGLEVSLNNFYFTSIESSKDLNEYRLTESELSFGYRISRHIVKGLNLDFNNGLTKSHRLEHKTIVTDNFEVIELHKREFDKYGVSSSLNLRYDYKLNDAMSISSKVGIESDYSKIEKTAGLKLVFNF